MLATFLNYFGISSESSAQAFGAAIGGFFGVILFFLARLIVEYFRSRPKKVKTYRCVTRLNRGDPSEMKGELEHHRGKVLSDWKELKKLRVKHEVWEWSREATKAGKGECLFFGPYSMDSTEPGLYAAVFRIRGHGFQKPKEIEDNWDLLVLDVLRTRTETGLSADGKTLVRYPLQEEFARQTIRVKDLTRSGWRDYELRFYSDGKGTWEYRCWAFDGAVQGGLNDLIKNCGTGVKIYFDEVTVKQLKKFNLPWG